MNTETFCEAEERRLQKLKNFKLPNYFKKIGAIIVLLSLLLLFSHKLMDFESETFRFILQRTTLIGLLFVALAKEKVEDEMIQSLRTQAFTIAFIAGVLYALVQPLVNYMVFTVLQSEKEPLSDLGDFQVLWFLLTVYIMFFYFLKRRQA